MPKSKDQVIKELRQDIASCFPFGYSATVDEVIKKFFAHFDELAESMGYVKSLPIKSDIRPPMEL